MWAWAAVSSPLHVFIFSRPRYSSHGEFFLLPSDWLSVAPWGRMFVTSTWVSELTGGVCGCWAGRFVCVSDLNADHACSPPDRITPPVPSAEPTWLTEAPWHPPTSDPLRDTAWHCSWMKDDSSPHSSSFLYFYLTVFSPYSTNSSGIEPWSCYRFTLVLRGRRSSLLFNEPEINCKIFPCMFVSFVKNRMI